MKKSTRALVGLAVIELLLLTGAAWMVVQVKSGAWHAPDPDKAITTITGTAGGTIGMVAAILLLAFLFTAGRGIDGGVRVPMRALHGRW